MGMRTEICLCYYYRYLYHMHVIISGTVRNFRDIISINYSLVLN
jgi:hypothetical protein